MTRDAGRSFAIRAGLFVASGHFANGVYLPFFPLWLAAQGLAPDAISLVLAMPLIGRILVSPALVGMADRFPALGVAAAAYAGLAAALLVVPFAVPDFWVILVGVGVAITIANTFYAFSEAVILHGVRQHAIDYGRVRLWGSIGFIVANLCAAALVQRSSAWIVMPLVIGVYAWTALVALASPRIPAPPASAEPFGLRRALADPVLRRALLAAALTLGGHGVFYSFSGLTWQAEGFGGAWIGAFWAASVLAEIALFGTVTRLLPHWGARRFILAGAVAAVIRWTLFPLATHPVAALALQTLHGASFGMSHLGAMMAIGAVAVPGHTARLQAAYQFLSGLTMAIAMVIGGLLFELSPFAAFWGAALVTIPAVILANGLPRGLQPQSADPAGSTVAPE